MPGETTRVLLVEDNAINQKVVTRMLERLGCEVDVAPDGDVGMEMARQPYALILMDCSMPRMDGCEATRRIRCFTDARSQVPIVALTAHATAADRERCLAAGMNDWLVKPVTPEVLVDVLERYAGWRAGAPASSTGILDLAVVQALVALGGDEDPEFFAELVGELRGSGRAALQEAREHLLEARFTELRRTMHRLKSAGSTLGAVRLHETCGRIELAGDAELRELGAPWLDGTERELSLALTALAAAPGGMS